MQAPARTLLGWALDLETLKLHADKCALAHRASTKAGFGSAQAPESHTNKAHTGSRRACVQERTFLGASLKRAEQALAVHAEQLTLELGACAQDVHALFARLGEVRGVSLS